MAPLTITDARAVEHEKYVRCYKEPGYRMGSRRLLDAYGVIDSLSTRGSYLDVSTGRGEMLTLASIMGFDQVRGTEAVPCLTDPPRVMMAEAHKLPFMSDEFSVVSMFDVMEHLIPGDDELACKELLRVSSKHVILAVNNRQSVNGSGDVLHINIRSYDEWDALFSEWFSPHDLIRVTGEKSFSQIWRIDLT